MAMKPMTGLSKIQAIFRKFDLLIIFFLCLSSVELVAEVLDERVEQELLLNRIALALDIHQIDVSSNLNNRDVVRRRIERPRLGRFPDLPGNSLANTEEIANWEAEYLAAQIGGMAIIATDTSAAIMETEEFLSEWLKTEEDYRYFISYLQQDFEVAEKIQLAAQDAGFSVVRSASGDQMALFGNFYATASQRLAVDTRDARRYRTQVTEIDYLGKRVRRNTNSLFRDDGNRGEGGLARNEPSVFLKETLGDEFTKSTIREITVPGGVALGSSADLRIDAKALVFLDGNLQLQGTDDENWSLPALSSTEAKTLFDFVNRSESIKSDAIVDIDADGRVRISAAFRDTDAGFEIMHADTQPFKYVPNLPVTKSVVIDTDVDWLPADSALQLEFVTDYEVRFLSANNMRIAQTRVALQYSYSSVQNEMIYTDAWGGDLRRLDENLDYSGLGSSMLLVAKYAGWVALFRTLKEENIPFLLGRYEFMKIDKSGRNTPARY